MFFVLIALVFSQVQAGEHGVRFVLDGDTIVLRSGEKIRYLGIDAPEMDNGEGKSEPLARASSDFNRRLIEGRLIRLAYDRERRDHYGRLLAYVFLRDGRMVNALIVREGLAVVMVRQPNIRYRDFLLTCQREAMRKRIGVWGRLPDKTAIVVGNSRSFRFHKKDCPFLARLAKGSRVEFRSVRDAFWAGYSPCKRCRPAEGVDSNR